MFTDHSQTLLGHSWRNHFVDSNTSKLKETTPGRKTDFQESCTNAKHAHRHDSSSDGTMSCPSSLWRPFVKKRDFNKLSEVFIVSAQRFILSPEYSLFSTEYRNFSLEYSALNIPNSVFSIQH